jgi:hypothetical protein
MSHSHSHGHDHSTYYLEQLCTIGICGLLGGVTIMLWYQDLLRYILAAKFHQPVLWGGVALVVLVVVRAAALWLSVGRSSGAHEHQHHHEDEHLHDSEPCHDHEGCCDHDPADDHDTHDHSHEHAHSHDHGHEHHWNPGRYIVLLLPVVLYFLGLPNAGLTSKMNPAQVGEGLDGKFAENTGLQVIKHPSREFIQVVAVAKDSPADKAGIRANDFITQIIRDNDNAGKKLEKPENISTKTLSLEEAVMRLRGKPGTKVKLTIQHEGEEKPLETEFRRATDIIGVGFKELEGAAYNPSTRQYYQGRTVRLRGQFARGADPRVFSLVRYKITCCAADAIPLNVIILIDPQSGTTADHIRPLQWVEVVGRIQFRKRLDRPDEFVTVLIVGSANDISIVDPDPNPYLQ